MNIWMHKATGQLILSHPQWEPLQIDHDEKFYAEILPEFRDMTAGMKIARGLLMQVGWLLENGNGVWFGVSLNAADQFEDLGEA